MTRNLIASLRKKIVGPNLTRFSQLRSHEVNALISLTSWFNVSMLQEFNKSFLEQKKTKGIGDHEQQVREEIRVLKQKILTLSERIDVLERLEKIKPKAHPNDLENPRTTYANN